MMVHKSFARVSVNLLGLMLLVTLRANAQDRSAKPDDVETNRVQAMISQSKKEAEEFAKFGGKPSDANHPNLKWAATLWQYRLDHPGTPATIVATTQALTLLIRSDRISEMQAKADSLKSDDPAWRQALNQLLWASTKTKDYSYLTSKAEALTEAAVDPEIKAKAWFTLGDAYWRKGDTERARASFQAVLNRYPKTPFAEEAEGNLREIEFLNVGQPAPLFDRTTLSGDHVSLARFKGKIVVLKFWGTY